MANVGPVVWYVRDNSTQINTNGSTPGTVGWSAVAAWTASHSYSPGNLVRQSGAHASGSNVSCSTTTMTVGAGTNTGTWTIGQLVQGGTFNASTKITALGTGTGGAGTYTVNPSQTVSATAATGSFLPVNERVFVATQSAAGNSGATEPNWTLTKGGSTTDNAVTWFEVTGQPAVNGDLTNTPTWAQQHSFSTSVVVGLIITDAAQDYYFLCTASGGTIGASEPSWNKTAGQTTNDGGAGHVTWTCIGTVGSFSAWGGPAARLQIVMATNWGSVGSGPTFFVGDDHAETQSGNVTQTVIPGGLANLGTSSAPCLIYCVDHTASVPPGTGNLKTTASVIQTGSSGLDVFFGGGYGYFYGLTFGPGGSGTGPNLVVGSNSFAGWIKFENCTLQVNGSSGGVIELGNDPSLGEVELENTILQFNSTAATVSFGGRVHWRNTASALAGTVPTSGLINSSTNGSVILIEGVDLSAMGSNALLTAIITNSSMTFLDCKLGSGFTLVGATNPDTNNIGGTFDFFRCDSGATVYKQARLSYAATLVDSETVVRTGGAVLSGTPISWQITTTANASSAIWTHPFKSFPISFWNTIVGVNRTVTLYGIVNAAAVPNNDDIWIDVAYLGSASTPLASFANSSKATALSANAALSGDSSSAWDSGATARQNSTLYALGNVIKVADNPGRVFFCTTAGTTAGSEPAGYASAVDGGSVTDNTAHFRAGCRFSMAVTLSSPKVQLAGYLRITVKAVKTSTTFYVDPQPFVA